MGAVKILVANLGSTSFKYRLYDMAGERLLARGGVDRIGSSEARCTLLAPGRTEERFLAAPNHAAALGLCLEQLGGFLGDGGDLRAVGFKAVHARGMTGVRRVDEELLAAMEAFGDVAPAHNPPYVKAMRTLAREFPGLPLVAAFETAFHETMPEAQRLYAVPLEWAEGYGIRRWGFHGASHRHVAERAAELLTDASARVISCHLGGSSSLCAIRGGQSVANSFGMSPQSGLPQSNRVGDFDPFTLPVLMRATGKSLAEILEELSNRAGLEGLSGISGDLRDVEEEAAKGNGRAQLAIKVFVASVRHYLGAYLVLLGGAEAIVFTGGIGENSAAIREAACAGLEWLGIALDPVRNAGVSGETAIHARHSRVRIWVVPANEELVVARQVRAFLEAGAA